MGEAETITEFADMYNIDTGKVIYAVVKYLIDDISKIHPHLRQALLTATDEEIEQALETMAEDIKATNNSEAIL
jgi:hypothetical protein